MRPLAVIGNVNVDLILGPATPWPKPGTEIIVDHDELRVGGSAGNCALAWQALGVDHQISANVGLDDFGRWLRESFAERASNWHVRPEGTTLSVGITHPDGERTFFTTRGHLPRFSLEDALACLNGSRLAGGIALLCGSFLTDDLARDYAAFFDWADSNEIAVALDTGWPLDGWTDANRQATMGWFSRSHCSLLNEVEMTSLTGIVDPVEAAKALKRSMPEEAIVVVKRGPEGAIGVDAGGDVYEARAPDVTVIDTIGAGDVFNAGFLAALAAGDSLATCLEAGTAIASYAISTSPRSYAGIPLFANKGAER